MSYYSSKCNPPAPYSYPQITHCATQQAMPWLVFLPQANSAVQFSQFQRIGTSVWIDLESTNVQRNRKAFRDVSHNLTKTGVWKRKPLTSSCWWIKFWLFIFANRANSVRAECSQELNRSWIYNSILRLEPAQSCPATQTRKQHGTTNKKATPKKRAVHGTSSLFAGNWRNFSLTVWISHVEFSQPTHIEFTGGKGGG